MRAKNAGTNPRRQAPDAADPIARVRKAVEAYAPAAHRSLSTGMHEAIVDIFANEPLAPTSKRRRPKGLMPPVPK